MQLQIFAYGEAWIIDTFTLSEYMEIYVKCIAEFERQVQKGDSKASKGLKITVELRIANPV